MSMREQWTQELIKDGSWLLREGVIEPLRGVVAALPGAGESLTILGVLLEVIGATLLASEFLSREMKPLDFQSPPRTLDLVTDRVQIREAASFFGALGLLMLIAGFILQFVGLLILYIESIPLILGGLAVMVGILLIITRSIYKWGSDQPFIQALAVLVYNLRGFLRRGSDRLICDVCHGALNADTGAVRWKRSSFGDVAVLNVGHPSCLPQVEMPTEIVGVPGNDPEEQQVDILSFQEEEPIGPDEDLGSPLLRDKLSRIYDADLE